MLNQYTNNLHSMKLKRRVTYKLRLLVIAQLFLLSCTQSSVFICTGRYAKAYHKNSECRGILSCKSDIKELSKDEAIKMSRTPCGYCY